MENPYAPPEANAEPADAAQGATRPSSWTGAYLNGALWSFGNGLVSTTLITYLAKDLGAAGLQISLILAFPHLAGVFRIFAPWVLDYFPDRRRLAVLCFLLSALMLLALPLVAWPGMLTTKSQALTALVVLWGGWHWWMYLGLVPFYSWLGDLAPGDERATCFSLREACMVAATIAGTLLAAAITSYWPMLFPQWPKMSDYFFAAFLGGLFILLSIFPLLFMPHEPRRVTSPQVATREMLSVLRDTRYWPLLAFQVWFSFANGLTAAPLGIYPYKFLGLSAGAMLALQSYMRILQVSSAPLAGFWLRGSGHKRPLIIAQMIVAGGPLFYLVASKIQPYWIVGAWTCWVAYVVLNVGLPSLMLKLSPQGNSPAYIAVNMATSGVAFACASLLGGWALDRWKDTAVFLLLDSSYALNIFPLLLIIGVALRFSTAFWIWRIDDTH